LERSVQQTLAALCVHRIVFFRPTTAVGHSLPIDLDGNVRFGQQRT